MNGQEFVVLVFCIAAIISIVLAYMVDRKRDYYKYPFTKAWKWAYIQSFFFNILLVLLLIGVAIGGIGRHPDTQAAILVALASATALAIPGLLVIVNRSRMAFIVMTLFTAMPLLWVINAVYVFLRWKEIPSPSYDEYRSGRDDGEVIDAEFEEVK